MLQGIFANDDAFVAGLDQLQNRITVTNQQITSGIDVNQPSDNPNAIEPILAAQAEIARITQVQTNLNQVKTVASTADSALATANTVINQLISIGAQGATVTTTQDTRTSLAQEVEQLEQQLVSLANTTVQGNYIFGGDNPGTAPYSFDGTNPPTANVAKPTNTGTVRDAEGNAIIPSLTAQQLFDSPSGSVLQATDALRQALLNNQPADVGTALDSLKTADTQLNLGAESYGAIEDWINNASTDASQRITSLQSQLSGLRDTDVVQAASQLTLDETAYQAAIQAQATLPTKNLFSYLG
jgi:flagellar hook-associated protein 3 FlgL